MNIKVKHADIHRIELNTRLPAKYGIVTMTGAPHVFIRVVIEVDGKIQYGIAADNLPPKWFKKDPEQTLEDEIDEMLCVIQHAIFLSQGLSGSSAFDLWRQLDFAQREWGQVENLPPLQSNFGTTLVERAIIEAVCKSLDMPFAKAVRCNALGIHLGDMDERLASLQPSDLLPPQPRYHVIARHTVGMADPLTDAEIDTEQRLDDGLPQSLAACIQRYGLKHFKVKISGDVQQDSQRLKRIANILAEQVTRDPVITFDGNEYFHTLTDFSEYWTKITLSTNLQPLLERLLFVEQPFHRDVALNSDVLHKLKSWSQRPRLIIDESDADPQSLARALELGYHGTSFKNCKGVFRGIAAACLIRKLQHDNPHAGYVLSGEDLGNIGPVALLQDLAVATTLGIESIERNGHHFFAGLSAFPQRVQEQVLHHHQDLYVASALGWPTVRIDCGELNLRSVLTAPLGVGFQIDVDQFTPVSPQPNRFDHQ